MTPKEYIESGAIETCILGLADEKDLQLLQAMEEMYPSVKTARENIELQFEQEAMKQAVPVTAKTNERILKMLQSEWRDRTPDYATDTAEQKLAPVVQLNAPKPIKWFRTALAASVILLMGSILINFYYFSKFASIKTKYTELLVQQNSLLTKQSKMNAQMTLLKNPVLKQIRLEPAAPGSEQLATIYWNTQTSEVYLMANKLAKPAAGQQYQLWAQVDGQLIDAGMLDYDEDNLLHRMKDFPNAQAFAITLEKTGGVPAPTLTALQVIGKV